MACACKQKSSNTVKPVKQIVKKISNSNTPTTTVRKTVSKKITYRRPI